MEDKKEVEENQNERIPPGTVMTYDEAMAEIFKGVKLKDMIYTLEAFNKKDNINKTTE